MISRLTAGPAARRRAATRAACLATCLAAACSGGSDATGPDDGPSGGGSGSGSVPAEMAGEWRYGSISPTNFWDDHTGVYSGNAYGFSDHYAFSRNGTFKEYLYIYTQSYNCRTQAWVEMSGTARFADGVFTTEVTSGRFKTRDSCASSRNFDRAMTASERRERSKSHVYQMRTDSRGVRYLEILDGRYDRVR